MKKFTNLYSIQKTLRFALKPLGKTAENIKSGKLLQKDEDLAMKYKVAKKIIDEYHKCFINDRLSDFSFEKEDLDDFKSAYKEALTDKNDNPKKKELTKQQNNLRKKISEQLKNDRLFKKEFIREDLPQWLNGNEIKSISDPISIIEDFNEWTSYFDGFNKNRKNIYTKEPHSTAIGFRLIHENLPRFLKNTVRYEKAKKLEIDFSKIEENFEATLDEVFTLDYFNKCLTQKGIDHYNLIIGGQSLDNNEKIQGINEVINLHVQQLDSQISNAPDEDKKELQSKRKEARSCKMEELYKQILSDSSQLSFRLKNISNDAQLCQEMQNIFSIDENKNIIGKQEIVDKNTGEIKDEPLNISKHLNRAIEALENADPSQIYIKNDKSLKEISQFLFGDWNVISRSLYYYAENEKLGKNKQGEAKKFTQKEKNDWIKKTAYFSLAEIHSALENYFEQYKDDEIENNKESEEVITKENKELALSQPLYNYFKKLTVKKKNSNANIDDKVQLLDAINNYYQNAQGVLDRYKDEGKEVLKSKKYDVEKIKNYLDALMDLLHFLKPLYVELKGKDEKQEDALIKDNSFYHDFDTAYEALKAIIPLYNQTRNHLTKKAYSIEKYKLNFDHKKLLDGFVESRTEKSDNATQYGAYIFRKNYKKFDNAYAYYLGISKDSKLFRCHLKDKVEEDDKSEYERLKYYQPKSTTFFGGKYSENKDKILKIIKIELEKIKNELNKRLESLGENFENEKKEIEELIEKIGGIENKDTPTSLIGEIKKFEENLEENPQQSIKLKKILEILNLEVVKNKCDETIKELQEFVKTYQEENPKLKEVIKKKYYGTQGFSDIVNDLQQIAKEKSYNYFSVSQKEFDSACKRDNKPFIYSKL